MRILCIGDSNTWGYHPGVGLRHEKRWTRLLKDWFPEDEIIEEGLCGRTAVSMDFAKRERCGIDSLKPILMTHKPVDLVIIMLGTNDLKTVFHTNAKHIASGIKEYIKIIKNLFQWEKYSVPEILIAAPVVFRESIAEKEGPGGNFDDYSLEQSRLLPAALEKICREYGVDFLNASDYAEASETDAIHLDAENHRRLAEGFAEKIREIHRRMEQQQGSGTKK